jgi:sigma-E factor negative regulatory protein RseA
MEKISALTGDGEMEKISALMDGELEEHQARQQFARMKENADLLHGWNTFHLIGDALRGERLLAADIAERLKERLALEPTVIAPRRRSLRRVTAYMLSAAASLSAVALVGWIALFDSPLASRTEQAAAPAVPPQLVLPAPQLAGVPSDGTMNEYLIVHQEFSPSTALQGLAPYIRSVSSAQPAKGR